MSVGSLKLIRSVITSVWLCITCASCTSPTVVLYGRYLPKEELKSITHEIEELGFDVESNTHRFPNEIDQSTIIQSPFFSDKAKLEALANYLNSDGWSVRTNDYLVTGNHWFKKNNLGLYLFPNDVTPRDRLPFQDLINTYTSRNCDADIKLLLNENQTYEIVLNVENESDQPFTTGMWKYRSYPYIELVSLDKQWWFYFEIEQLTEVIRSAQLTLFGSNH